MVYRKYANKYLQIIKQELYVLNAGQSMFVSIAGVRKDVQLLIHFGLRVSNRKMIEIKKK